MAQTNDLGALEDRMFGSQLGGQVIPGTRENSIWLNVAAGSSSPRRGLEVEAERLIAKELQPVESALLPTALPARATPLLWEQLVPAPVLVYWRLFDRERIADNKFGRLSQRALPDSFQ